MIDDAVILRGIIASFERAMADLRRFERARDAIGLLLAGDWLTLKQAAYVRNCSDETIRKECETTAATDCPLDA